MRANVLVLAFEQNFYFGSYQDGHGSIKHGYVGHKIGEVEAHDKLAKESGLRRSSQGVRTNQVSHHR